jgi:hypothetical protein
MTYEEWETFGNGLAVGVLAGAVIILVWFYFATRRPAGADGKRRGRPVLAIVVAIAAFVGLGFIWNLIVWAPYPEYAERQGREHAETRAASNVIDGVEGSWRPNNASRTDYFVFTNERWSSVNPDHDTTISWDYEVLHRDGPCMRIRSTSTRVVEAGEVTRDGPRQDDGDPLTVCVDPETDLMVMRFDSGGDDVYLVRMN